MFVKMNEQEKWLGVTFPLTPYFCTLDRKPAPNYFLIAFKFNFTLNKHMWLVADIGQHRFKTTLCKRKCAYKCASPGELC